MSDLSVSASATSRLHSGPAPWTQKEIAFHELGQALQAGDLPEARKAFAAVGSRPPQAAGSANGQDTAVSDAMASLGQALQSGDLAGARKAYEQLAPGKGARHRQAEARKAAELAPSPAPMGTTGRAIDLTV